MRGPEHLAFAVLTTGAALLATGHGHLQVAASAVAVVTAAGIGSLVPDIDHPKAWISNRIPATLLAYGLVFLLGFGIANWSVLSAGAAGPWAAFAPLLNSARPLLGWAVLAAVLGVVLLLGSTLVAALMEHRGPTHSLTVAAALTLVACLGFALAGQPWTLGLWFGWGYLSHLLTDLLTPMGCPSLLWPLRGGDLATWGGSGAPSWSMPSFGDRESGTSLAEGDEGPLATPSSGLGRHEVQLPSESQSAGFQLHSESTSTDEVRFEPVVSRSVVDAGVSAPSRKICPRCGGELVMREAKRGAHAGNRFWGCASYPKCRYIENVAG